MKFMDKNCVYDSKNKSNKTFNRSFYTDELFLTRQPVTYNEPVNQYGFQFISRRLSTQWTCKCFNNVGRLSTK